MSIYILYIHSVLCNISILNIYNTNYFYIAQNSTGPFILPCIGSTSWYTAIWAEQHGTVYSVNKLYRVYSMERFTV